MQNDFVKEKFEANGKEEQGKLIVPGAVKIVRKILGLVRKYRKLGVPIIYTMDWHPQNAEEFKIWPAHCVVGTPGAEIICELTPTPDDIIIRKNAISAFTNPNTAKLLKALSPNELIVVGVATDYCVKAFAIDAIKSGFKVIVRKDMVRGVNLKPGDVDKALTEMKAAGVKIAVNKSKDF